MQTLRCAYPLLDDTVSSLQKPHTNFFKDIYSNHCCNISKIMCLMMYILAVAISGAFSYYFFIYDKDDGEGGSGTFEQGNNWLVEFFSTFFYFSICSKSIAICCLKISNFNAFFLNSSTLFFAQSSSEILSSISCSISCFACDTIKSISFSISHSSR